MSPTRHPLAGSLADTPSRPGVYLFKDDAGNVIYVGKAANLKNRLSSYFVDRSRLDPKTGVLVGRLAAFETVVTATEKEALILESNLIKRHRPRYNVILKDDKRYPSLRLNIRESYPALEVVRVIRDDGALYFGPYTSSTAVKNTLKVIDKTFKLRKCRGKRFRRRERPCLNYQMGLCLAPCAFDIPEEDYQAVIKEVVLFLKGRTSELLSGIKRDMARASREQLYEQAAASRDKMFAIEKILEKQVVATTDFADRDVIGLAENERFAVIVVLHVRGGLLVGTGLFPFERVLSPTDEILGSFIRQFYGANSFVPDEVLTGSAPAGRSLLAGELRRIKGRKAALVVPRRGEKKNLVAMAEENAARELENRVRQAESNRLSLETLRDKLKMDRLPETIECFDNSHLSGTGPVAAMAVFKEGRPAGDHYRRYAIRQVNSRDDYASMREVLSRRYGSDKNQADYPDLLLVDGGKGQLNIARAVIRELGLAGQFAIAAISKKNEQTGETGDKIYLPGRANPVKFARDEGGFLLLQHIRDEAHRLAVTYQKKRRKAAALTSSLDAVPGVGQRRKKQLLDHFGTMARIREAEVEELAALPGITKEMARAIKQVLGGARGPSE
ncbi:MAG: excinuclease ABC subunit UvrC [Desulfosudaceae bacterium]